MLPIATLDHASASPLYRQLYLQIRGLIESGQLPTGARLPATRELAGQIGLNRTTISAAYELLESDGLITGHVGRGSFVSGASTPHPGMRWDDVLKPGWPSAPSFAMSPTSFSSARPSELLFPIDEFRETCSEVINGDGISAILQLGSPAGFAPLRRYLLERARAEGAARESDDILITSGVQQAFDLLQRTLAANGETVLLEDPVYPGLKNAFVRAGARVIGIPVCEDGLKLDALERAIAEERPKLLVVTSNFQNPTGATLPVQARKALLAMARRAGVVVIENDIYGPLAYEGNELPSVKALDETGDTLLLRSFSKLAFPGLRVGWAIGPKPLIERLTEAKQCSDLHTDQLSQAVLLRFAESGRLEKHRQRVLEAGRERLRSVLAACTRELPETAEFTRPRGGMNLWVRLPAPLDAGELLARAEREGVTYLPGKYFAVSRPEPGSLRISFAGVAPDRIASSMHILGKIFASEVDRARAAARMDSAPAMV